MGYVLDVKACVRVVLKTVTAVDKHLSVVLQGSVVSPKEAHAFIRMTAAAMTSAREECVVAAALVENRA